MSFTACTSPSPIAKLNDSMWGRVSSCSLWLNSLGTFHTSFLPKLISKRPKMERSRGGGAPVITHTKETRRKRREGNNKEIQLRLFKQKKIFFFVVQFIQKHKSKKIKTKRIQHQWPLLFHVLTCVQNNTCVFKTLTTMHGQSEALSVSLSLSMRWPNSSQVKNSHWTNLAHARTHTHTHTLLKGDVGHSPVGIGGGVTVDQVKSAHSSLHFFFFLFLRTLCFL